MVKKKTIKRKVKKKVIKRKVAKRKVKKKVIKRKVKKKTVKRKARKKVVKRKSKRKVTGYIVAVGTAKKQVGFLTPEGDFDTDKRAAKKFVNLETAKKSARKIKSENISIGVFDAGDTISSIKKDFFLK